jgi:dTDP-glucose 4,6-dehydratase
MKILLSGAAGFVGSHVLRHLLIHTRAHIVCPVSFRHKGLPERIVSATAGMDASRVEVEYMDLTAPIAEHTVRRLGPIDVIMNVASDSHVDRSIMEPADFIERNVSLMNNMLEYARMVKPFLFLQMSTDEVYGPAHRGYAHREWDTPLPSNPYSASKAAQEATGVAYWRTYGVPLVITNTMNIIGEMQDPEKMVPKIMQKVARGEVMPLHTSASGEMGSRFYLHARNLADAWLFLMNRYMLFPPDMYGDANVDRPEKWHIVGEREVTNLEMAQMVASLMGRELLWEGVDFHSSRPGHDLRYALDGSKLAAAGWKAPMSFEESVRRTVEWTLANPAWL